MTCKWKLLLALVASRPALSEATSPFSGPDNTRALLAFYCYRGRTPAIWGVNSNYHTLTLFGARQVITIIIDASSSKMNDILGKCCPYRYSYIVGKLCSWSAWLKIKRDLTHALIVLVKWAILQNVQLDRRIRSKSGKYQYWKCIFGNLVKIVLNVVSQCRYWGGLSNMLVNVWYGMSPPIRHILQLSTFNRLIQSNR